MNESFSFTRTKRVRDEKPTYTYTRLQDGVRVKRVYDGCTTIEREFLIGEHFVTKTGKSVVMTNVYWTPHDSAGCYIKTTGNPVSLQKQIDDIYFSMLDDIDLNTGLLDPESIYIEGASQQVWVNRYERDSRARKKCLDKFGYTCQICNFDFVKKYGLHGQDFIEVHHIKPLHTLGKGYRVNPEIDLIPVCSNCHSMLHRGGKNLKVEDLKSLIKTT
ncbi:HNH endonuclease [Aliivibrio wodanis]|uniref:HNH endonuclease n=1 Tax=Aliivibrio wodanis TaxID=80852 RepID=UPI00406CAB6C